MNTQIILAALVVASIAFTVPAQAVQPGHHAITCYSGDRVAVCGTAGSDRVRTARVPRQARGRTLDAVGPRHQAADVGQVIPRPRQARIRPIGPYGTVPTAAGIEISCAPGFCGPAQAVIADLVASGFTPNDLGSYARGGHVHGSYHYRSRAVDVAQCGWGCTPAPKQTLRMIVASHGLRDGCEFRDSGHFDDGPHLPYKRILRNCGRAYADAVVPGLARQAAAGVAPGDDRDPPFYPATADFKHRQHAHKMRLAHR